MEFRPAYLSLPVIVYICACLVAFIIYQFSKARFYEGRANIAVVCAAMGNTGYFGLPLVFLLFPERTAAIYVFMMLGLSIFEATVGYYLISRGAYSARKSFVRVARYPAFYAIAAGLLANYLNWTCPDVFWTYWNHFRGAYIIVGMMIVGSSLSKMRKIDLDPKLLATALFGKFLLWPLLVAIFILLDKSIFQAFAKEIHQLMLILSVVPPGANVVSFAAQLRLHPETAASTVLIGTMLALFWVPALLFLIF